jgi:integrase/recombinase XerD
MFDADKSLNNNARDKSLDPVRVAEYKEAMQRGDVFPPVVAYKTSPQARKFIIASGNHRLQAAIQAKKPLRMYDISGTAPEVIMLYAFEANARHGLNTSEDERISQALHLIANGATIPSAAAAVNLPRRIVDKASQRANADQRFLENGIAVGTIEKLSTSSRWRLSQITTDEGFVGAARVFGRARRPGRRRSDRRTTRRHLLHGARPMTARDDPPEALHYSSADVVNNADCLSHPTEDSADPLGWEASRQLAEDFLLQFTGATLTGYTCELRDLWRLAQRKELPPLQLQRAHLQRWVREMQEVRGLAPRTIARRLAAVSSYYTYATEEGVIATTPTRGVKRPKVPAQTTTTALTLEQMAGLLQAARAHSPRAHLLVSLLVCYGARISEALGVRCEDLREVDGTLTLRLARKGTKVLVVPLVGDALEAVHACVGSRRQGPMLLSVRGEQLGYTSAVRLLRAVAVPVFGEDGAQHLRTHDGRRSFLTAAARGGIRLDLLQQAASHATVQQTMSYVQPDELSHHPVHELTKWLHNAEGSKLP